MKQQLIFMILTLFLSSAAFSQTKKSSNKPSTKSEIDRLADKYKDTPKITIYTSHEDLIGEVDIEYNADKKPVAIIINGESENKDAIAEFLSNIIAQKEKQGYRASDGTFEPTDANWLKFNMTGDDGINHTYKKNKMVFIAKAGSRSEQFYEKNILGELVTNYKTIYWFHIETIDYSRKGGTKATKFDF
jgi:hypothetical protein